MFKHHHQLIKDTDWNEIVEVVKINQISLERHAAELVGKDLKIEKLE